MQVKSCFTKTRLPGAGPHELIHTNMRKRIIYILFTGILFSLNTVYGQKTETNSEGYTYFYYDNGNIASEGILRDGKPDGYWKTYYESGVLKSEGNRKNFLLDSLWTFYNEQGKPVLQINYKNGKKNGNRTTYREKEYTEEYFVSDVKDGYTTVYYADGKVKSKTLFINGLENGLSKTYDRNGWVTQLTEYKNGFVVSREKVNYTDRNGDRQGRWVTFWDNGNLHQDGTYRDGRKHGYFKIYNRKGDLLTVEKYDNGDLLIDAREVAEVDIRTDYYPDGKVKTVAGFRNGKPEGIRREYDRSGKVIAAYTYENGVLTGEGIIDDQMQKNGEWKSYYPGGTLQSKGEYRNGKRVGPWFFYYKEGTVQQQGNYNDRGNYEGEWKWFYETGALLRVEHFIDGREEGLMQEFDPEGNIVVSGTYSDGLQEGEWEYNTGDSRQIGSYRSGMRFGTWKVIANDGTLLFKGDFIDDNPNGRQVWYWDNGKIKDDATYLMGQRHGEWTKYDYLGNPFITITYRNGTEISYDGIKLNN